MKYELKPMSGTQAKRILAIVLQRLSGIEEDDMTTLELDLLHRAASNPPKRYHGAEEQINNASYRHP